MLHVLCFNRILMCMSVTVPRITDQFEGYKFDRYKDALIMALKKCRGM